MTRTPDVLPDETITSSWGNEIRDRTTQVFADAAQRDAEHGDAPDGSACVTLDNGREWLRRAGKWTRRVPDPPDPPDPPPDPVTASGTAASGQGRISDGTMRVAVFSALYESPNALTVHKNGLQVERDCSLTVTAAVEINGAGTNPGLVTVKLVGVNVAKEWTMGTANDFVKAPSGLLLVAAPMAAKKGDLVQVELTRAAGDQQDWTALLWAHVVDAVPS